MKEKILQGGIVFLFIILIGAMSAGFIITNRIQKVDAKTKESFEENKNYILVIIDKSNPIYDTEFRKGLLDASANEDAYIELIELPQENYSDKLIKQLHMAKYLQVDGIILHSIYNEDLIAKTQELFESEIPVVALNDDLPISNRISYVGINRYELGKKVGEVFEKEFKEKNLTGDVIIIDGANPTEDVRERLVRGINEVIGSMGGIYFKTIEYDEMSLLTAESIANHILLQRKHTVGIFCTDPISTAGTLQVLLDNNRVNDIVLIGMASQKEMIESVQSGAALEAVVVLDHYQIGYDAVKAIVEYNETGFVSSYIHPEIKVVTKTNAGQVLLEMEEEKGED